jgi:CDP-glucose 4,6-dehydratase
MGTEEFWRGKRIFITGHTGFKGSWLCLWLHSLGANVSGYALSPPTEPSLYVLAGVDSMVDATIADVRDAESLQQSLLKADPEVVIHMAAQPLVRESYRTPVETYAINVMGTVHLLEGIRRCRNVKAVVNVTTDKCYENREWHWGYREGEAMGGYDPYSSSKGCSELVTAAYRNSFFNSAEYAAHGVSLASARAGNVIGGGDWADDRLICDCVRALLRDEEILIRNPHAIRPWQHVLEPLSGYLLLAQRLYEEGVAYAQSWNFGPDDSDAKPVEWIVQQLCKRWGKYACYRLDQADHPHEATYLKLDCSKAKAQLGWQPRWNLEQALTSIVEWTQGYQKGTDLKKLCLEQITAFQTAAGE